MKTKKIFATALVIATAPLAAHATNCYKFNVTDQPTAEARIEPRTETWCYETIEGKQLYVYNADGDKVKPELAVLVEPDGVITHGSLIAGQTKIHRIQTAEFNPFSVPLHEPVQMATVSELVTLPLLDSAKEVLDLFLSQRNLVPLNQMLIEPGSTTANANKPWRGYWWPYKGLPLSGNSASPMAKLDRFVTNRTGSNPGSARWENTHHVSHGIWWEGHCNGWAASSIIRAEPRYTRWDSVTGLSFSVSDIKGLMAEDDYCVNTAFFGHRYNGRAGENINDVDPLTFHRTLTYYIGQLGKAVAMDYRRDPPVDNNVVSSYTMSITNESATAVGVRAVLTIHKYDGFRTNNPGVAPSYQKTYSYVLYKNSAGAYTGGAWRSGNPDFLWVPLSPASCSRNNQRLPKEWVQAVVNLPAGSN